MWSWCARAVVEMAIRGRAVRWGDLYLESCCSRVEYAGFKPIHLIVLKVSHRLVPSWRGRNSSPPTHGLRPDAKAVLSAILARISFLMVGTIEPRKGHAVVLEAFNQLWQSGHELNLVIVGKQGWMVDAFLEQLRSHAEYNKRLFWLEGISDEYLESVYAASTCLIAASYGEGFGLPLIEAAQHRLPIVARDIRVFREVAGEHAFYFSGTSPEDLACALQRWLALYEAGRHPVSGRMPRLTWEQSARQLLQIVLGGDAGRTCKTQNDTVDQGSSSGWVGAGTDMAEE